LTKQLLAFASGLQNNAVMSPIAKALAPDDAADVSAHYAHASAPFRSLANVNHDLFRRGEILATIGNEKRTFRPASIATVPAGVGSHRPFPIWRANTPTTPHPGWSSSERMRMALDPPVIEGVNRESRLRES
jgi:hypothetical protein